jgi:hypothetical protein
VFLFITDSVVKPRVGGCGDQALRASHISQRWRSCFRLYFRSLLLAPFFGDLNRSGEIAWRAIVIRVVGFFWVETQSGPPSKKTRPPAVMLRTSWAETHFHDFRPESVSVSTGGKCNVREKTEPPSDSRIRSCVLFPGFHRRCAARNTLLDGSRREQTKVLERAVGDHALGLAWLWLTRHLGSRGQNSQSARRDDEDVDPFALFQCLRHNLPRNQLILVPGEYYGATSTNHKLRLRFAV